MPTSGVITGCTEGFDAFLRSGFDSPDLAAEGISAVFCGQTRDLPDSTPDTDTAK